ncbi:hypothetical protein M1466_03250 [Candidatus Dependentiae bacterium]|nr:hypothetical protein [Candidatus Dependentiae bacterium]
MKLHHIACYSASFFLVATTVAIKHDAFAAFRERNIDTMQPHELLQPSQVIIDQCAGFKDGLEELTSNDILVALNALEKYKKRRNITKRQQVVISRHTKCLQTLLKKLLNKSSTVRQDPLWQQKLAKLYHTDNRRPRSSGVVDMFDAYDNDEDN